MKISGSTPLLPPAATQARATHRPETDAPAQAPAPAPTSEPSQPEAPAETGKPHGLVRAADHSNRSDVAALRQWINHPDLRSDLTLPDLSTEHKGNGFAKAVAAYEAVIAVGNNPAPPPDSAPVVTDPDPVVSDPAPVVPEPTPLASDADSLLGVLPAEPTPGTEAEPT